MSHERAPREPSKLEQTAIHEAGHAVVATMVRRGMVEEIFISETPRDVTEEYGEVNATVHGLTGGVKFRKMQTSIFENGLISYSGFFAECEHLYRCGIDLMPLLPRLRHQSAHDIDRYHALLVVENLSETEIRHVEVDIGATLKHYFDSGAWEAICKVADLLLERRAMTGNELLVVLHNFP